MKFQGIKGRRISRSEIVLSLAMPTLGLLPDFFTIDVELSNIEWRKNGNL